MKLQHHEVKRFITNAILVKKVSPDTKLEVTKRDLGDWSKDVLHTLQFKKQFKDVLLVCVEIEGEKS